MELSMAYNIRVAAEMHDIGKPYVKAFVDSKGNPCETAHYYQHQCVGAWIAYGCSYGNGYVAWLISAHMEPYFNSKYYNNLPPFMKRDIDLLHEADLAAH
jgi:CRISPR/Cas system-associated endonuclease Cas3-HD